jgi:hypothetical protein
VTAQYVIAINALAGGWPMVPRGLKWIYMRFFAVMVGFGLAALLRFRTGVFLFFTGDVTLKTYIFVVAPLAVGAFLMAFMIPEPSAFAP